MKKVRQRDTDIEQKTRSLLHSFGFRFRLSPKQLPGRPDIANCAKKWAIFVHGCFWHAHDGCGRFSVPQSNSAFWEKKFAQNRERDLRKIAELEAQGWRVLVVWGCEVESEALLATKLLSFLVAIDDPFGEECYRVSRKRFLATRSIRCLNQVQTTMIQLDPGGCLQDSRSTFERAWLRGARYTSVPQECAIVRVADLFCGCGGLSLGVREAAAALGFAFEPVLAVDSDQEALRVYEANFRPKTAHAGDIFQLVDGRLGAAPTERELRNRSEFSNLDILLAGPPCQGFSDLNNRTRRADPRNDLYWRVARFVEIFRPRHVLIENVPQIRTGISVHLDETLGALRALGYHVESGVVDLSALGVPQKRKRHVVLASIEAPLKLGNLIQVGSAHERSIAWAIDDLLDEKATSLLSTHANLSAANRSRIEYMFENHLYNLPNKMRPECHQENGHSYLSMYGRLRWDRPSQTITSGYSSPGQGRYVHPSRPRTITAHEAARLQYFPDSFDFSRATTRRSLARMIGNAVPMKLSYVVALGWLKAELEKG